ncbi:hypothetical protein [Methylocapsa palsarum]|uniref:hypothetical protein n=1 Tax=Methylocapsa palsarum TaxID=1612308 RepID=UPI001FCE20C5|nr:hypothetical protein [Methylocapsa palsarum]
MQWSGKHLVRRREDQAAHRRPSVILIFAANTRRKPVLVSPFPAAAVRNRGSLTLSCKVTAVLDRRQEQSERRREHIAELNKRAAESDLRLKRLYDAIEAGVADIGDPALKDRIDGLKAMRDQARADAERAQALLENFGGKAVTPQMLRKFAETAHQRIRVDGGGYPRASVDGR